MLRFNAGSTRHEPGRNALLKSYQVPCQLGCKPAFHHLAALLGVLDYKAHHLTQRHSWYWDCGWWEMYSHACAGCWVAGTDHTRLLAISWVPSFKGRDPGCLLFSEEGIPRHSAEALMGWCCSLYGSLSCARPWKAEMITLPVVYVSTSLGMKKRWVKIQLPYLASSFLNPVFDSPLKWTNKWEPGVIQRVCPPRIALYSFPLRLPSILIVVPFHHQGWGWWWFGCLACQSLAQNGKFRLGT